MESGFQRVHRTVCTHYNRRGECLGWASREFTEKACRRWECDPGFVRTEHDGVCVEPAERERQLAEAAKRNERKKADAEAKLQRRCDGGDSEACRKAGRAQDALAMVESRCAEGDAAGCQDLRVFLEAGARPTGDYGRISASMERLCHEGRDSGTFQKVWACHSLAQMHREGWGVPRDPGRARAFFALACDRAIAVSCAALAEMSESGKARAQPSSPR
jgi:TPR repeat protein